MRTRSGGWYVSDLSCIYSWHNWHIYFRLMTSIGISICRRKIPHASMLPCFTLIPNSKGGKINFISMRFPLQTKRNFPILPKFAFHFDVTTTLAMISSYLLFCFCSSWKLCPSDGANDEASIWCRCYRVICVVMTQLTPRFTHKNLIPNFATTTAWRRCDGAEGKYICALFARYLWRPLIDNHRNSATCYRLSPSRRADLVSFTSAS